MSLVLGTRSYEKIHYTRMSWSGVVPSDASSSSQQPREVTEASNAEDDLMYSESDLGSPGVLCDPSRSVSHLSAFQ